MCSPPQESHRNITVHSEYFAPVLGVMRVDTLQEAIEAVNATDYGLTSGLQTLDADELAVWLEGVKAGNLYVNRSIREVFKLAELLQFQDGKIVNMDMVHKNLRKEPGQGMFR